MYNSVVIGILARAWEMLRGIYEYSALKRIRDFIVIGFKRLSKGSRVVELLTSDRNLIEEGLIYELYCRGVDWVNGLIGAIEIGMEDILKGSLIYNSMHGLFGCQRDWQMNISLFSAILGVGIMAINLARGIGAYEYYILPIIFIMITIAGCKTSYKDVLDGSFVFNFIRNIFVIDEEVDQWW